MDVGGPVAPASGARSSLSTLGPLYAYCRRNERLCIGCLCDVSVFVEGTALA